MVDRKISFSWLVDTRRLKLRPVLPEDAGAIFGYRSDSVVNRYQGWIPAAIEDVVDFIDGLAKEPGMRGTWFQMGIFLKDGYVLIGDIGVHFLDSDDAAVELGCTLASSWQGKGYATEALKGVINYLIEGFGKKEFRAYIDPGNIESKVLFKGLGFKKINPYGAGSFGDEEWVLK